MQRTANSEIPELDEKLNEMIHNFSKRVYKRDFIIHDDETVLNDFKEEGRDFQICRGMYYYLMEDLPYIPLNLQSQWFEIEHTMLSNALESAYNL